MKYSLSIRLRAQQDIEDAFDWYLHKNPAAAQKLLLQLDDTFKRIIKRPLSFAIKYKNVRFVELKSFPIGVYYLMNVSKKKVIIIAVLSSLKDPKNWPES